MDKKNKKQRVAAFDFDGTITYRDSLVPFLFFSKGYFKSFLLFASQLPLFVLFLLGRSGRKEVKEGLLQAFFSGVSIKEINTLARDFARHYLPDHVRPEALERLCWHQKKGDLCILVSASIEAYLVPWAASHGFQHVLSSRIEVDERGEITGKLMGQNCRGMEKVRRLEELLGNLEDFEIFAYGDSAGDKEMLEIATHPFYRHFPKDE